MQTQEQLYVYDLPLGWKGSTILFSLFSLSPCLEVHSIRLTNQCVTVKTGVDDVNIHSKMVFTVT